MTMVSLSDFMPYVIPYVNGCSAPMAEQYVLETCIDFCTHAAVAQEILDPIDVQAGVIEYDVGAPNGTVVFNILDGWYEGRPLQVFRNADGMNRAELYNTAFRNANVPNGTPTAVKQGPNNTILLNCYPAVDSPGAITLIVSTRPTRKATTVADVLYSEHAMAIGQGTVSRLMRIPNATFHNGNFQMYEMEYMRARSQARIRAMKSFGPAEVRIRARRF